MDPVTAESLKYLQAQNAYLTKRVAELATELAQEKAESAALTATINQLRADVESNHDHVDAYSPNTPEDSQDESDEEIQKWQDEDFIRLTRNGNPPQTA